MSDAAATPETLVGVSFGDPFRAQEFLTAATRLASKGRLRLLDAVFIAKDEAGQTHVRETLDPTPGRAALSGAVWVSLVGLLLGGPVGWIAGAGVGGVGAAAAAKVFEIGIPDELVAWFREAVRPGTTTLALLVTDLDREALGTELARFEGGHLLYANLEPGVLQRYREALGEVEAVAAPSDAPDEPV
jgi:uncharacterized membrane protein